MKAEITQLLSELKTALRLAWEQSDPVFVETYFQQHPNLAANQAAALDIIFFEYCLREELSHKPVPAEYFRRFPEWRSILQQRFDDHLATIDTNASDVKLTESPPIVYDNHATAPEQPNNLRSQASPTSDELPKFIGRYQIEKILGHGGFGLVYQAFDAQLQRPVAIKVPHPHLVTRPEQAKVYLTEARTVANLEHPNIVPVYDVGSDEQFPVYVVSKYIDGSDLAVKLRQSRFNIQEAVEFVALVADALHHAHKQGLVHRDIKPGNILLDKRDTPYVTDFGLALRERDIGKGSHYVGTPAYMSPEQARGEGHRVDGRSDIFSIGIVLYEILSGRRPFKADSQGELLEQICKVEARPLRQIDDQIPKELERICLKAMAKKSTERYTSAKDFSEDLRAFLSSPASVSSNAMVRLKSDTDVFDRSTPNSTTPTTPAAAPDSDSHPIKIVPKGLRSFDAADADFFLELLPGPRDRNGLPDSIRFWKTRLEEFDSDKTFLVGLIYGPSGCGKSSLVKAGLIPRLSDRIIPIYIEATGENTESRLLNTLRKRFPRLATNLDLKESMAALRLGRVIPEGKKVVIFLDQFEQWLHTVGVQALAAPPKRLSPEQATNEERAPEGWTPTAPSSLIEAMRHCDGSNLQCIVMVRDDFWMASTRFMRELEIRLVEGSNSAAVDLFDEEHARRVLTAFGRAFGKLPEISKELSKGEKEFLKLSMADLSSAGKVISVRLTLFAEMMKSRSWNLKTLKEVGGAKGIGVTFLEETFSATTAPPEHRYHQKAARSLLRSLLPESGSEIKGHMRSEKALLIESGYSNRETDFQNLIQILDSELRLITPTDPEGIGGGQSFASTPTLEHSSLGSSSSSSSSSSNTKGDGRFYQLTHDYLVPSLQEWLTRKQRETRKGRAELKLAERASAWNVQREKKQLPTVWEWLNIRLLTDRDNWTRTQREMMGRAGWRLGRQLAMSVAALMIFVVVGATIRSRVLQNQETTRIQGLVGQLIRAEPAELHKTIQELDSNPEIAAEILKPLATCDAFTPDEHRSQLHARLALVPTDQTFLEPLLEEMLTCKVNYLRSIRQQLKSYAGTISERLWSILKDGTIDSTRRFRAAIALAEYVPATDANWASPELAFIAHQLVASNAEFQPTLRENLRPISDRLLPELETIFGDTAANDAQRLSAANAFADYAARDIPRLSQLLAIATPDQFNVLYPLVATSTSPAIAEDLAEITATLPPDELGTVERIPFGQRRANAAVTLLRLGQREEVLPAFDWTDDPEALTQFIFRCKDRGVGAKELLDLLSYSVERLSSIVPEASLKLKQAPANASGNAEQLRTTVLQLETNTKRLTHAKYALLLALGEYPLSDIPEARRDGLVKLLGDWYQHDPSSGVHGAAGWLLRQWGHADAVRQVDQIAIPYSPGREWFTLAVEINDTAASSEPNSKAPASRKTFYYTFIVFSPDEYQIGSHIDEPDRQKDEVRHPVKLTRTFALLDREITMGELIAFNEDRYTNIMAQVDAKPSDAGFAADWYDSVAFCRWLSHHRGLSEFDQAYADPESLDEKKYPREPNPVANWAPRDWPLRLDRQGFRLPTEAEWEIAARAQTRTPFGFGSEPLLMKQFGWYLDNSARHVHPPKELRSSVRGLFDLHGNVFEWTHDRYDDYNNASTDPTGPLKGSGRVIRGGGWTSGAANCRLAIRNADAPTYRTGGSGFRFALSPSGQSPEAEESQAKPSGGGTEGAERPEMP